ncbi:MAG: PilW family protein [Candidatus Kryptoniota bacterium]
MKKREGFTLIELVVAMAILMIFIFMAFQAFSYINAFSRANTQKEAVVENLSNILDQLTKEIRQTVNNESEPEPKGIEFPSSGDNMDITDILSDSSPQPGNLGPDDYYIFDTSKGPILRFYIYDSDNPGTKHRITYTLSVPNDGSGYNPPHYLGIDKRYWDSKDYEPCEILYSNETWNGSAWVGISNQPVTDQVITNFTIIRPNWSDKVAQIVIEARVKTPTGASSNKVILVSQISLRQ